MSSVMADPEGGRPSGNEPSPADGGGQPVDPQVPLKKRRRKVTYEQIDSCKLPLAGLSSTDAGARLREVARSWAKRAGERLVDFRSPQRTAEDGLSIVASCGRHCQCKEGQGKLFKFIGSVDEEYNLVILSGGECSGEPFRARLSQNSHDGQPSVDERQQVLQVTDDLLSRGLQPTPATVATRLTKETSSPRSISSRALTQILRHRKKMKGLSTSEFADSAARFGDWSATHQDRDNGILAVVDMKSGPLQWVAIAPQFWNELHALLPEVARDLAPRQAISYDQKQAGRGRMSRQSMK